MPRSASFRLFLVMSFVSSFAFTTIATINLVYQAQVAGLDPLQLVLVGTALETVCFFSQMPTGVVADVYSRRWAIVIGTVLMGVGFTLEGSVPRFCAILASQVLWGVGATFVDGADAAWLAAEVGDEALGTALLRSGQAGQIGAILGIPASVAL